MTGVLPTALGSATRIVQTLLKAGKEYICLMHLHKEISESQIKKTAKEFTGKIKQMPPIKSAIKRQLRTREVYYFNILEINGQEVLFKIGCEAGTYIRKICDSFGKKLNTGAHMAQLVRTKAGPFDNSSWHTLHDLKDAYEFYKKGDEKELRKIILPIERAVEHLPKLWVLDNCVNTLCHGSDLNIPGISKLNEFKEDEIVVVLTLKNELICLGEAIIDSKEIMKEEKGKAVKTHKVFMKEGTYPKYSKETT